MIRVKLIAENGDSETHSSDSYLKGYGKVDLEITALFPERPRIDDFIKLSDFIKHETLSKNESSFLFDHGFEMKTDGWYMDEQGVYLKVWCNPV